MTICLGAHLHHCPFPRVPNSPKYIFSPNTHFPIYPFAPNIHFPQVPICPKSPFISVPKCPKCPFSFCPDAHLNPPNGSLPRVSVYSKFPKCSFAIVPIIFPIPHLPQCLYFPQMSICPKCSFTLLPICSRAHFPQMPIDLPQVPNAVSKCHLFKRHLHTVKWNHLNFEVAPPKL